MDDLLSQDEINALLSGGALGEDSGSGLSMEDSQLLDEVASIFSNAENSVFGMLSGKDVDTALESAEVLSQKDLLEKLPEAPFVFRATCGGFDDIPLTLVVEQRGALMLADLMMGGEGKELPEEPSDLYLNAAQEGLSQVVGASFTSLSGLLGGRRLMPENTTSSLAGEDWLPFTQLDAEASVWVSPATVQVDGLDPFKVWSSIPLDSALAIVGLMRQIIGEQTPKDSVPPPDEPAASAHPAGPAPSMRAPQPKAPASNAMPSMSRAAAQQPAPMVDVHPAEFLPLGQGGGMGNSRIDMLADIPVRVTVELGKTRKNISEILALTTGSVIELDKMAGEPVDILVNGKPIARGEVVVIDENFGVRITDVLGSVARVHSA
nr:flagellar motor switch protein FliN [uncultured Fretibacterium sp.]